MTPSIRPVNLTIFLCTVCFNVNGQEKFHSAIGSQQPTTIILFRTFDIFSFDRSYKLYASDSLLGRIKTNDVIVIETYDDAISFQAQTKGPSLNKDKRTNFQKYKSIRYPVTLKPGQVYFVKCGYLTQNLFDLPRQPTIRLLKPEEIRKFLQKKFLQKKIRDYLFDEWLEEKDLKKHLRK